MARTRINPENTAGMERTLISTTMREALVNKRAAMTAQGITMKICLNYSWHPHTWLVIKTLSTSRVSLCSLQGCLNSLWASLHTITQTVQISSLNLLLSWNWTNPNSNSNSSNKTSDQRVLNQRKAVKIAAIIIIGRENNNY